MDATKGDQLAAMRAIEHSPEIPMLSRTVSITLAATLAAMISMSAAQAGMGNANLGGSGMNNTRVTPSMPDVKAKQPTIDAKIKLNCYHTRERNELGVYVHRTHCG